MFGVKSNCSVVVRRINIDFCDQEWIMFSHFDHIFFFSDTSWLTERNTTPSQTL
jgi:hypothetical protein